MKTYKLVASILLAIVASVHAQITQVEKEDDAQFLICSTPSIDFQHEGYCSQTIFQLSGQESDKNFLFSPYGLDLALQVSSEGATGKTKEVLNLFCPSTLNSPINLATGTAIATGNINCKQGFKDTITSKYQASVLTNDKEAINQWVEQKTRGGIKNFIEKSLSADSISLISTIYFKGEWHKPLKSKIGNFTNNLEKKEIEMLYGSDHYKLSSGDIKDRDIHWQGIDIPYIDNDMSLTIIVPTRDSEPEGDCINEFIASLNSEHLKGVINNIDSSNKELVNVEFPKMKFSTTSLLVPYFISLGIKNPFSSQAEFKNISDSPFFISDILQTCTVDINEQGTEASSATKVTLIKTSIALPQRTFIANRPFLFLIRQGTSIIFEGIFKG